MIAFVALSFEVTIESLYIEYVGILVCIHNYKHWDTTLVTCCIFKKNGNLRPKNLTLHGLSLMYCWTWITFPLIPYIYIYIYG